MRRFATIASAATCATAIAAHAQERPPGVALEARLAYGVPLGNVDTHHSVVSGTVGDPIGQTVESDIAIWIDAGYRINSQWFAGLFFDFAPGSLGGGLSSTCSSNQLRCSVFDMRVGGEVQFHPAPGSLLDPWLGGGLGYEWLHVGFSGNGGAQTWASGFELLNLQGGLELSLGTRVHVGPFAALTTGIYDWNSALPFSNTFSGPSLHEWLVVGVMGTLDLGPPPPGPDALQRWSAVREGR
jgi:hypothetical protein